MDADSACTSTSVLPIAELRSLNRSCSEEKELFSVTMYRWLHDEERQRAIRHVPFNVQAFVDVALKAANATECVSLDKVQEGPSLHNRVFALKFNNGVEFIAKIPFPTIGPKHLCTASEVATLDFLRTKLFPVPVVRAWCSKAESSPVGVEYIMYEKIPGIPLVQLDNNDTLSGDLEEDPFIEIAPHIAGVVYFFSRARFTHFGSIYYKEDMPDSLRGGPFYGVPIEDLTSRFCIGPTVDREFWRAGRAALDIDRGPCKFRRLPSLAALADRQVRARHALLDALCECVRVCVARDAPGRRFQGRVPTAHCRLRTPRAAHSAEGAKGHPLAPRLLAPEHHRLLRQTAHTTRLYRLVVRHDQPVRDAGGAARRI
ncbi:hypothetical protein BD414DRAFT_427824 [Trametes punicea]|nr:hypothetical protein BD414DRAFT_427824 [Trametes punicea]